MAGTRPGESPARLVVVTGVPGAGKTTLGAAVAEALGAPFLSLDTIKETLYSSSPDGRTPHELRQAAEARLADELAATTGTVVVDIWIAPERDTDRVVDLLSRGQTSIVELLCRVPAEIAVGRYADRPRSGPHSPADDATLRRIRDAAAHIEPLPIGRCIEVDTSRPVDVGALIDRLPA